MGPSAGATGSCGGQGLREVFTLANICLLTGHTSICHLMCLAMVESRMDSVGVHPLAPFRFGCRAGRAGHLQRVREWVTLHRMEFGRPGITGRAPSLSQSLRAVFTAPGHCPRCPVRRGLGTCNAVCKSHSIIGAAQCVSYRRWRRSAPPRRRLSSAVAKEVRRLREAAVECY